MHLTILPAPCYGCMTRCVVSASSLGYLTTRTPNLHTLTYRDLKDVLSTCKHMYFLAALSVSTDIRYLLTKAHVTRVWATKAAWFCLSNDHCWDLSDTPWLSHQPGRVVALLSELGAGLVWWRWCLGSHGNKQLSSVILTLARDQHHGHHIHREDSWYLQLHAIMFIPCKIFSLAIFLLSFPFCLNLHLIVSAARSIISTKHSIYDYWSGRTDWSQHITIFSSPAYLRYTGHEEARRWWMLDIPHKCRHNYTHYRLLPPTFGPELDCTLGKHCTVCFGLEQLSSCYWTTLLL